MEPRNDVFAHLASPHQPLCPHSSRPAGGTQRMCILLQKMCTSELGRRKAESGWQHSCCEALSAVCSCSAHDPCRRTMRLSRSPLSPLPTVVSAGSILTWVNPSAGQRATGAQTACISVVGMAEAGAPTRPVAYFPRVKWQQAKSPGGRFAQTCVSRKVWDSKVRRHLTGATRCCAHTVCR